MGIFLGLALLFVGLSFMWSFWDQKQRALLEAKERIALVDSILRWGVLETLDAENIAEFSQKMGVWLVVGDLSSLPASWDESSAHLLEDFELEGKRYQIIAPISWHFETQQSFLLALFVFCLLLVLWLSALALESKIREFFFWLKDEGRESSSVFCEIEILRQWFERVRRIILRKEMKNIKQAKKIKLKNAQLSSLISAISHELKNPLSVIKLANENLAQRSGASFFSQSIDRQILKLNALTHKLNFVFNLKNQALELEDFDLFALVLEILQMQGEERLKIQGEESWVRADRFLIEQVILNLISNALKYSQDVVEISVKEGCFEIVDYGLGIPAKECKKITKKFYKINPKSENSFGLGLFIVKKILALHQVTLEIKSTPPTEGQRARTSFGFCFHRDK